MASITQPVATKPLETILEQAVREGATQILIQLDKYKDPTIRLPFLGTTKVLGVYYVIAGEKIPRATLPLTMFDALRGAVRSLVSQEGCLNYTCTLGGKNYGFGVDESDKYIDIKVSEVP